MQNSDNAIVILDFGMGNLRSVHNKFKALEISCKVSGRISDIENADKLILPGVGHFGTAMNNLKELGLINLLNKKVLVDKTPILGICLGVQLFAKFSQEGNAEGLGWLDANVERFVVSDQIKFKIPHTGWNSVTFENRNILDEDITKTDLFYFVHSYHLKCNNQSDVWMKTEYDYEFVSGIKKNNIYGTQFHPEKSHDIGLKLLKRFAEL